MTKTTEIEAEIVRGIMACYYQHGREHYGISVDIFNKGGLINLELSCDHILARRTTEACAWTSCTAYGKGYLMALACINQLNDRKGREMIETIISNPVVREKYVLQAGVTEQ